MATQFERDDYVQSERSERSIPQLLRDFTRETTALLRDEAALARTEITDRVAEMGKGLAYVGAGALVLFAGVLVLLDAVVVMLLDAFPTMQPWLAPLIVGGLVLVLGAVMLAGGKKKLEPRNLKPRDALEANRRDREMLKEKLS